MFQKGDRVRDREDDMVGTIHRVLTGAAVDYCTPLYEVRWDHAPGDVALGSRHYSDELERIHVGHYSRLGGTWWCDTCDSPYCELA